MLNNNNSFLSHNNNHTLSTTGIKDVRSLRAKGNNPLGFTYNAFNPINGEISTSVAFKQAANNILG